MKGNAHGVTRMSNTRYFTLLCLKVCEEIDEYNGYFYIIVMMRSTHTEWKIMNY